MGVNLEMYRARIGLFNRHRYKVHVVSSVFNSILVTSIVLSVMTLVMYLILLCGDVELNPGPQSTCLSLWHCNIRGLNTEKLLASASEYVASATVENTCITTEKNRCVLIEPTFSDNRKFKIARVLVQPVNIQVPIRLVNLSFSPINLKKHYIIGKTVEIDESDISGNNTECPPEKCTDSIDSFKCKINRVKSNRKVCDLPDHVKELYEKNVAALPNDELKAEFADIISEFSDVFAKDSTDVGSCSVLKHKFDTGKAHPTKQGLRRTPREFEGEEKKYLQDQSGPRRYV